MRLAPGGEASRHADITDPDAGASEGKVVRVHIPLISSERCVFQSWSLDGNTSSMVMRPGTAAYLDVRKPHTAVNTGDTPRVHLVVDCCKCRHRRDAPQRDACAARWVDRKALNTDRCLRLPPGGARTPTTA
jgi:hypothetical protein